MKTLLRKVFSLMLVVAMLLSLSATAFAASNSPYVEGNPENIVITLSQLEGSTYQVTIRNDRATAIGDWKLSFKTNFKLSNPNGVSWSVAKNNTYSFWDAENGNIASGDSFSFTVVSDKKKNSEIHNVVFDYSDIEKTEREKEPLEDIGEAYFKEPKAEDVIIDPETGIAYVKNQLLISAFPGVEKSVFEQIANDVGADIVGYISLTNDYQIEFREPKTIEEIENIAAYIDSFSFVSAVTLNIVEERYSEFIPNDPIYNQGPDSWTDFDGDNWGLEALNVPAAWDHEGDFSQVKVAVYDRNFKTHEDIVYDDIVNNSNDSSDHGTHVTGIMAAQHNNGTGISGVATDTRLYAYSFSGSDVGSSMGDKYAYALLVGNHVKVINYSAGMGLAIQYAASHGNVKAQNFIQAAADVLSEYLNKLLSAGYDFVIVTSAGNTENSLFVQDSSDIYGYHEYDATNDSGKSTLSGNVSAYYDCALTAITDSNVKNHIIVVGAIDHTVTNSGVVYNYANFSNVGDRVDVCAPGVDIMSTVGVSQKNPTGYALNTGTSMASPHVAGIVAMMFQANPSLKASSVVKYLKWSSTQSVTDKGYTYVIPDAENCYKYAIGSVGGGDVTWPSGIICGQVTNIAGNPISDAKITAIRQNTGEYNLDDYYFSFETDEDGEYLYTLPQGTYTLIVSSNIYLPTSIQNVVIEPDQTKYMEPIVLGIWDSLTYNDYTIKGKVINALNGDTIEGATIRIRKGWNNTSGTFVKTIFGKERTTSTINDGTFSLTTPSGSYTIEIVKDGFVTGYFNAISVGSTFVSDNPQATFVLTPLLDDDEYRIVLTWGDQPHDLDSHLTYYSSDDMIFHVYFASKSGRVDGEVVAKLDYDDTTSYGPETVTITLNAAFLDDEGVFKYSVHDFSNAGKTDSTALSLSNAAVRVYSGNTLIKTYTVPTDNVGTVWHVFDITKNGIKNVNEFYNSSSSGVQ